LERRYPRLAEAIFEEGDGKTRKDWTPYLTLGEMEEEVNEFFDQ
jgi:hypothetical protein